MSDDEQAIRDLIDEWMAASKAGDLDTVLGLMTDDVVFMVPGREPFGKAEFAAGSKAMAGVKIDGTPNIQEVMVLGDWAWMRNHLRISVTPPGGATMVSSGYILTILRKNADGRWQIARDANLLRRKTNGSTAGDGADDEERLGAGGDGFGAAGASGEIRATDLAGRRRSGSSAGEVW